MPPPVPKTKRADRTGPPDDGASPSDSSAYDATKDWLVYVLISQSSVRTYVGIALDMDRRLAQHNGLLRGGASSTRAGRPWALGATYGPFPSRGAAQQAEARLKKWPGGERLDQCASALH